tara:strand:- start:466 stop:822 length:357 start_codon:yes stop_codon:yes gene_type:complete
LGACNKLVALAIFGREGNTACQLILIGALAVIGAGARQVVLDGRTAKPDTMLAALDERAEEKTAEELIRLADDCAVLVAMDDVDLLPEPELPPPQEIKPKQLVITSHFFTQVFIVITS